MRVFARLTVVAAALAAVAAGAAAADGDPVDLGVTASGSAQLRRHGKQLAPQLAKLERAHDQDLGDGGLVEPHQAIAFFAEIEPQAAFRP